MPERELSKTDPVHVSAIKAMQLPGFVDRSKNITPVEVTDPTTGKKSVEYRLSQTMPKHLLRKQMLQVKSKCGEMTRVPWVQKGTTIVLPTPWGEKFYFLVRRSGNLRVYYRYNRKREKHELVMGGYAKVFPDNELYHAFNEKFWRDEK